MAVVGFGYRRIVTVPLLTYNIVTGPEWHATNYAIKKKTIPPLQIRILLSIFFVSMVLHDNFYFDCVILHYIILL